MFTFKDENGIEHSFPREAFIDCYPLEKGTYCVRIRQEDGTHFFYTKREVTPWESSASTWTTTRVQRRYFPHSKENPWQTIYEGVVASETVLG